MFSLQHLPSVNRSYSQNLEISATDLQNTLGFSLFLRIESETKEMCHCGCTVPESKISTTNLEQARLNRNVFAYSFKLICWTCVRLQECQPAKLCMSMHHNWLACLSSVKPFQVWGILSPHWNCLQTRVLPKHPDVGYLWHPAPPPEARRTHHLM